MHNYTHIRNIFFNSRNIKYAFHGCKSKLKGSNEYYHYIEMIYTDRDASLLRMFDAFIESAPQLVLQIYLILREQENLKNCEDVEVHSRKFLSSRFFKLWIMEDQVKSWNYEPLYRELQNIWSQYDIVVVFMSCCKSKILPLGKFKN